MKRGNGNRPSIGPSVWKMLTEAWLLGSVDYGSTRVRTGHTIAALVSTDELARDLAEVSKEFEKIQPEVLKKEFANITAGSAEDTPARHGGGYQRRIAGRTQGRQDSQPRSVHRQPHGERQSGKIDPVLGRDFEIRQVIDILMRRRQNNPILTGEAGVGKTAVVEGFALRVAQGDVRRP